jgi:2'-5' RNA ligase
MKRVFAAIDISEDVTAAIETYARELRRGFEDLSVRWERTEKLHITVKFAGPLDDEGLGRFTQRVQDTARSITPFRMRIAGTGAFVKRRGPSVLWLGTEALDSNEDPFASIAEQLNEEGLNRPFKAHITISRVKHPKKARDLIDRHIASRFESAKFNAREIVVYESKLLPTGSVYTRLAGFPLGGTGWG